MIPVTHDELRILAKQVDQLSSSVNILISLVILSTVFFIVTIGALI